MSNEELKASINRGMAINDDRLAAAGLRWTGPERGSPAEHHSIEFVENLVVEGWVVLEVKVDGERTIGGLSLPIAIWDPFWRALVRSTAELERGGLSIGRTHGPDRFL